MSESTIKCIIFDCDGTLVDSERLCQEALVDVFARFGGQLSLQECMARFQGGKLADILAETRERCGIKVSIDVLEPLYREECRQRFESELQPIAGVAKLLAELQGRDIDICVASNGPVEKMAHTLGLTGLRHYFNECLFSAFEIQCWKPEPDLLHYAAMQMGYSVNECLFVDDTINGIQASINAEMKALYFRADPARPNIDHPLVTTIENMPAVLHHLNL
ncbi:6-phosphogluconate phosphatase [Thaumasiovibrio subtropicus]|uniref:6-phosphogluconate phosphatase n=1 Tax=Thaumasiovibrio subtropicus TaxID=1891207 RepID=UPI000B34F919|nr:6-phosphogluconate phosphatase [Thaumasiovibrio subtropicus]